MLKKVLLTCLVALSLNVQAAIDRGLVALNKENAGVYLSWRLLTSDPQNVSFDVYRVASGQSIKVNTSPITESTNFIDPEGSIDLGHDWYVKTTTDESNLAAKPNSSSKGFLELSTGVATHGRSLAYGDLQGDGVNDFVIRFASNTADPYYTLWSASRSTYKLVAFNSSGKLWTYDMGWAIEQGIWYSAYAVHDLDGDGKAELIVKAGDESIPVEQMRDESGRVLYGPEYLKIINGEDGNTVLAQTEWPDRTGFLGKDPDGTPLENRKYEDYNRWSRNFISIAYLDGKTPHVIVSRGTYGKHKTAAYKYSAGKLTQVWYWENKNPAEGGDPTLWGQGAHSLQAHDVDNDGKDEVVIGGLVLDDNGQPLYSINKGHVDHVYIGDLIPSRPGKEMYYGAEKNHKVAGAGMVDAATGQPLWGIPWATNHLHDEGMCADIVPTLEGVECYSGESDQSKQWLFDNTGNVLTTEKLYPGLSPESILWDADAGKELFKYSGSKEDLVWNYISDFRGYKDYPTMVPTDTPSGDRQYLVKVGIFDVIGDWREELIVTDRNRLLIYPTTELATTKYPWLMEDRGYRLGVVNSSTGYYQQPTLSVDLASQMAEKQPKRVQTRSHIIPTANTSLSLSSLLSSGSNNSLMLFAVSWETANGPASVIDATWGEKKLKSAGKISFLESGTKENVVELFYVTEADYPACSTDVVITLDKDLKNDLSLITVEYDNVDQDKPFLPVETFTINNRSYQSVLKASVAGEYNDNTVSFVTNGYDSSSVITSSSQQSLVTALRGDGFAFAAADGDNAAAWTVPGTTRMSMLMVNLKPSK